MYGETQFSRNFSHSTSKIKHNKNTTTHPSTTRGAMSTFSPYHIHLQQHHHDNHLSPSKKRRFSDTCMFHEQQQQLQQQRQESQEYHHSDEQQYSVQLNKRANYDQSHTTNHLDRITRQELFDILAQQMFSLYGQQQQQQQSPQELSLSSLSVATSATTPLSSSSSLLSSCYHGSGGGSALSHSSHDNHYYYSESCTATTGEEQQHQKKQHVEPSNSSENTQHNYGTAMQQQRMNNVLLSNRRSQEYDQAFSFPTVQYHVNDLKIQQYKQILLELQKGEYPLIPYYMANEKILCGRMLPLGFQANQCGSKLMIPKRYLPVVRSSGPMPGE